MPKNLAETLTARWRTVNFLKTGGDNLQKIFGASCVGGQRSGGLGRAVSVAFLEDEATVVVISGP